MTRDLIERVRVQLASDAVDAYLSGDKAEGDRLAAAHAIVRPLADAKDFQAAYDAAVALVPTGQLVADLLEYVEWLETNGGRSLQDGGLTKPLARAAQFVGIERKGDR